MNIYKLVSNKERNPHTLAEILAPSIQEAELFLAKYFPDDYFGANIVGVSTHEFSAIAIKEAYPDDADPLKLAINTILFKLARENEICDVVEDDEGTCYLPWDKVISEDGYLKKGE